MDRKTAAQKLIDIANSIDKQAAEETFFVCRSCNHTASLDSINGKRAKVASDGGVQDIEAVTVNDVVACPACEGDMRYVPTEFSEKYYVEAGDGDEEPVEEPKPEPEDTSAIPTEDESAAPEAPKEPSDEGAGDAIVEDDEELDLDYDEDENEATPIEDTPEEGGPSDEPEPEPEPEPESEPEEKKPPKKKKDKPDDGKPNIPKDRVPKFEFPKKAGEASTAELAMKYAGDDAFMAQVSKYL